MPKGLKMIDHSLQVAKMVGPKKEALAIAEGELKGAEDKLAIKKAVNSGTFWSVFNKLHWGSQRPNPSGLLLHKSWCTL